MTRDNLERLRRYIRDAIREQERRREEYRKEALRQLANGLLRLKKGGAT